MIPTININGYNDRPRPIMEFPENKWYQHRIFKLMLKHQAFTMKELKKKGAFDNDDDIYINLFS